MGGQPGGELATGGAGRLTWPRRLLRGALAAGRTGLMLLAAAALLHSLVRARSRPGGALVPRVSAASPDSARPRRCGVSVDLDHGPVVQVGRLRCRLLRIGAYRPNEGAKPLLGVRVHVESDQAGLAKSLRPWQDVADLGVDPVLPDLLAIRWPAHNPPPPAWTSFASSARRLQAPGH